jgi:hypothetical protein
LKLKIVWLKGFALRIEPVSFCRLLAQKDKDETDPQWSRQIIKMKKRN